MVWLNSRRWLGSSASMCCGVVGVLWWVNVVREWVAGFNTVSVWVGLWVDWCVHGGGSGGFRGGGCGCGCCLVGVGSKIKFNFPIKMQLTPKSNKTKWNKLFLLLFTSIHLGYSPWQLIEIWDVQHTHQGEINSIHPFITNNKFPKWKIRSPTLM